jgi:hypothetical protein
MKLPLLERPYAPLQLTPVQCDAYERLAMAVVRDSIDEFDDRQQRTLDPRLWKAVKAKENVTIYKQLEEVDPVTARTRTRTPIPKWSMPKLLGLGSVVGDFDDVVYGLLSPDVASTKVNTAYVDDDIVDCDVLATIQRGTFEDPLRFVGIKWLAKSTPSTSLVWPRDVTVVEATGVYVDPKGQRYGFHVMHSVEVPQCPSLAHLGIVRGQISSCVLFKSTPDRRSVEIFMTAHAEPGGNLRASIAMSSEVDRLMGFAKAVYTAEKKKLGWLLRESYLAARARQRGIGAFHIAIQTDAKGRQCCALCVRPFSTFRSRVGCELCHTVVCSRCETTRKIASVDHGCVKKATRPVCKTCITTVSHMSAADFARCEYVPGGGGMDGSQRGSERSSGHGKMLGADSRYDSLAFTERSSGALSESFVSIIEELPTVVHDHTESYALVTRPIRQRPPPTTPSIPEHQKQLWMQMQQLRVQAEQAYELTRQNAEQRRLRESKVSGLGGLD